MKGLYELICQLTSSSLPDLLAQVDERLDSICDDKQKYDGAGFYFLVLKNELKVFPFLEQNRQYQVQEFFIDSGSQIYPFLKANRIHSILLRKDVDVGMLGNYLLNEGPRPPQVLTNIYSADFDIAEKIFEAFLAILLYPGQQLNSMVRTLADYTGTSESKLKDAIQKVHGDWVGSYNQLKNNIDKALDRYDKITFVIRYPLGKSRNNEIEPEFFHIFFEDAELDIDYAEQRKSEFLRKPLYIPKRDRRERLDSLSFKAGVTPEEIFSLICAIRGRNKVLFTASEKFHAYLNQRIFPDELREKFGKKYPIPPNSKIDVVEPGHRWVVKDATKVIKYLIEKSDDKLEIYQKIDEMEHIVVNPVKVGVIDVESEFSDLLELKNKNNRLKQLLVRMKQHNNRLQEMIRQFQTKIEKLKKQLEEERKRKGGYEQIRELEDRMAQLKQEKEKLEQVKKQALQELKTASQEQVNLEFISRLSKDLHMAPEDTVKLLPADLIEQIIRDRMQGKDSDETAALVIESGRATPIIEKGLREGQFSSQQVQEFIMDSVDPLGKKEVARDLARQLARATPLPNIAGYRFHSFFDFTSYPGGDIGLVYPLDFARIAIGVLDLEGVGLEQSCNLFSVKVLFERLLADYPGDSPEKLIYRLQKEIAVIRQSEPSFHCFAALIGILNCMENTFTYSRAALPYVYLYNRNSNRGHFLQESGVPRIGVDIDAVYYQKTPLQIKLEPADVLFVQTNGFLDCIGGYDNFEAMMSYLPGEQLEEFFRKKVNEARNGRPLEDDICLFSMELLNDKNIRETEN